MCVVTPTIPPPSSCDALSHSKRALCDCRSLKHIYHRRLQSNITRKCHSLFGSWLTLWMRSKGSSLWRRYRCAPVHRIRDRAVHPLPSWPHQCPDTPNTPCLAITLCGNDRTGTNSNVGLWLSRWPRNRSSIYGPCTHIDCNAEFTDLLRVSVVLLFETVWNTHHSKNSSASL